MLFQAISRPPAGGKTGLTSDAIVQDHGYLPATESAADAAAAPAAGRDGGCRCPPAPASSSMVHPKLPPAGALLGRPPQFVLAERMRCG
jgi:hypothetical protein